MSTTEKKTRKPKNKPNQEETTYQDITKVYESLFATVPPMIEYNGKYQKDYEAMRKQILEDPNHQYKYFCQWCYDRVTGLMSKKNMPFDMEKMRLKCTFNSHDHLVGAGSIEICNYSGNHVSIPIHMTSKCKKHSTYSKKLSIAKKKGIPFVDDIDLDSIEFGKDDNVDNDIESNESRASHESANIPPEKYDMIISLLTEIRDKLSSMTSSPESTEIKKKFMTVQEALANPIVHKEIPIEAITPTPNIGKQEVTYLTRHPNQNVNKPDMAPIIVKEVAHLKIDNDFLVGLTKYILTFSPKFPGQMAFQDGGFVINIDGYISHEISERARHMFADKVVRYPTHEEDEKLHAANVKAAREFQEKYDAEAEARLRKSQENIAKQREALNKIEKISANKAKVKLTKDEESEKLANRREKERLKKESDAALEALKQRTTPTEEELKLQEMTKKQMEVEYDESELDL